MQNESNVSRMKRAGGPPFRLVSITAGIVARLDGVPHPILLLDWVGVFRFWFSAVHSRTFAAAESPGVPTKLKRYYGQKHIHYITCSCFHRRQYLGTPQSRDVFCEILEEVRRKFDGTVAGYVLMPEHFHLLLTEPAPGDISGMMHILKQRVPHTAWEKAPGEESAWPI
jgi:REP element-mobilizing transposase RayT